MPVARLQLRSITADEEATLRQWARSQTGEARRRERARICLRSHAGESVTQIALALGVEHRTVRRWIARFNAEGLTGLEDAGRIGRPPTFDAEAVGTMVATALRSPESLDQPFATWSLDRLVTYLHDEKAIAIHRTRLAEILRAEGLRWRTQETWFGERVDPAFAEKRGRS